MGEGNDLGYNKTCFQKQDLESFSGVCSISKRVNTYTSRIHCVYLRLKAAWKNLKAVPEKFLLQNKVLLLSKGPEENR